MNNPFLKILGGSQRDFDPRIKIAWLVINIAMVLQPQPLRQRALSMMIILLVNRWVGLSLNRLKPFFKISTLLGLQLILIQGVLQPSGTRLFSLGRWTLFSGGLMIGVQGILTVVSIALLFFQFFFWTSSPEITRLLIKIRLPFRYAFMVGLAVRYLPLIHQDLQSIYQSQSSRGLKLDSYLRKITGLPPIIIPLILKTLQRVEGIALSMELKGFGFHQQVTVLEELHLTPKDLWALLIIGVYGLVMSG